MNLNILRWQTILFASVTSLVSVVGQGKTEAEVISEQQGRLSVVQMNFIDRFESETEMEFKLHLKISEWSVCDRRAHYKKHKNFVERWEQEMIPPSFEHPHRPIWLDMWKSGEEFAKSAYAMKKEGARLSCDLAFESDVILEVWELIQNRTLKVTVDPPDAVQVLLRQFFVTSLKNEIKTLWKYRDDSQSIAEEIKWRLENAKRIFGVDPFEVIP